VCQRFLNVPDSIFKRFKCEVYCAYKVSVSVFYWWRGTVVERRSMTGELSLSCARPAANA